MNACVALDDDQCILCIQADAESRILKARQNIEQHFLSGAISIDEFVSYLAKLDESENGIRIHLQERATRLAAKIIPETRACLTHADLCALGRSVA